ncbi:S1 family peptidase [Nocardia sp. XZ_19_385]|uniref:S1 family peptidase n=1 Tax=Nocardia sp. XZ_19_385 TaxID=2769488 RepID=UPI00188FD2F1|nr:S1 family peptidase [Nocardia sp. XZ_19_385]
MRLPRLGKFRSKSAIAASAAILLFAPTAAVANAEPEPAPAPALPVELITAIARDLKISPEEYLRRSDVSQELASFAATAQRQFPEVYGGSWLNETGQAVVALTQGPGADEARKAAQDAGFEVRTVAKSESALRGEKSAFQRWLDEQPEPVAALIRGVAIDTVNNSIAVRVDQPGLPMPSFVDPSRVLVMAPPVAAEQLPEAAPIAGAIERGSLTGGDGYASVAGRTSLRCSFGFNGTLGGKPVNITAGHCNPALDQPTAVHELVGDRLGTKLGAFQKSVLGSQDYSILRVEDEQKGRFDNSGVKSGGAPIVVDGVADPVVGAPVCKSGSRTGFSCGVINAVDQTVQVGDRELTQSFSANICALPGDSGGPIVSGRRALGISSASSVADYPVCAIPEFLGLLTGNAPQLFAQPLNVVLSDNPGLRVNTN